MTQGTRETGGTIDFTSPNVTFPVTGAVFNPQLQQAIESNSGDIDATYVAALSIAPRATWTTRTMTALSSFGIAGAGIDTMKIWAQQLVNKGGTRHATSKNIIFAGGMCFPRTLTAVHNGIAELVLEGIGLSADGTTVPVSFSSGTMDTNPTALLWTLGPTSINGTAYDVAAMTIDFGIIEIVEGSEGFPYPTEIFVMARRPSVSLTIKDSDGRAAIGLAGLAQDGTDSVFYLRKLDAGGTRVADATAEHIKFSIDDGLYTIQSNPIPHGERAMLEVLCTPVYDGTNAIILIDTASAIT